MSNTVLSEAMNIPVTPTSRWLLHLSHAGGHRYFFDLESPLDPLHPFGPRVGIADESGLYPENTTDGVLYLDRSQPILLASPSAGSSAYIPLVSPAGQHTTTPTDWREAEVVARVFRMEIMHALLPMAINALRHGGRRCRLRRRLGGNAPTGIIRLPRVVSSSSQNTSEAASITASGREEYT